MRGDLPPPLRGGRATTSAEGVRLEDLVPRASARPLAEVGGDQSELVDAPDRSVVRVEEPDPRRDVVRLGEAAEGQVWTEPLAVHLGPGLHPARRAFRLGGGRGQGLFGRADRPRHGAAGAEHAAGGRADRAGQVALEQDALALAFGPWVGQRDGRRVVGTWPWLRHHRVGLADVVQGLLDSQTSIAVPVDGVEHRLDLQLRVLNDLQI